MTSLLHKELGQLEKQLLTLTAVVEESVQQAIKALSGHNRELAQKVIDNDDHINRLEVDLGLDVVEDRIRIVVEVEAAVEVRRSLAVDLPVVDPPAVPARVADQVVDEHILVRHDAELVLQVDLAAAGAGRLLARKVRHPVGALERRPAARRKGAGADKQQSNRGRPDRSGKRPPRTEGQYEPTTGNTAPPSNRDRKMKGRRSKLSPEELEKLKARMKERAARGNAREM